MSKIEVFHIDKPNSTRMMGEVQFKLLGKDSDWRKKPKTKKADPPKDTGNTSTSKDDGKGKGGDPPAPNKPKDDGQHSADKTVATATAMIKKLGKDGNTVGIEAFIKKEYEAGSLRSGVKTAADKYLKA